MTKSLIAALLITFVVQSPQLWCVASANIIESKASDASFSSEKWKNDERHRLPEFKKFLDEYDFIGMPKEQVSQLLGVARWNTNDVGGPVLVDYLPAPSVPAGRFGGCPLFSTTTCGRGGHTLQILLDETERVKAWRINSFGAQEHWFEKNVIFPHGAKFEFDQPDFGLIAKLNPKEMSSEQKLEYTRDLLIQPAKPDSRADHGQLEGI